MMHRFRMLGLVALLLAGLPRAASACPLHAKQGRAKPASEPAPRADAGQSTEAAQTAAYRCPHCKMTSAEPGTCTMCHLELEKVTPTGGQET